MSSEAQLTLASAILAIWRNRWLILALTISGLGLGVATSLVQPQVQNTTATFVMTAQFSDREAEFNALVSSFYRLDPSLWPVPPDTVNFTYSRPIDTGSAHIKIPAGDNPSTQPLQAFFDAGISAYLDAERGKLELKSEALQTSSSSQTPIDTNFASEILYQIELRRLDLNSAPALVTLNLPQRYTIAHLGSGMLVRAAIGLISGLLTGIALAICLKIASIARARRLLS